MAVPTPTEVAPWYLRNINQALALDSTSGEVYVRTGLSGGDIIISGPVTIPGEISLDSFPATSTDSFGRLRVSNPYTLFDSQARYYDHNQFSTSTTTGGNFSYNANSSTFDLNVTNISGSSVIRETKRVFPYQPGKSLLILNTFSMNSSKPGLRQRVGFFGAQNGIYFEDDAGTLNLVIRSYTSGVVVEERVPQSLWNGDNLSGSGGSANPSSITLNPSYDQIFWSDVEWLGVGSVRCGFIINGTYYICHTFNHANIVGNTTTYMTTATLPIRYEITNTSGTSGSSTLRQICSTVISEGGYNQFSTTQSAGTGITPKDLGTNGVYRPIVSIRLAPTRLDAIIVPRQVDILSPDVAYFRWQLLLNATLTDATWAGTSSTGSVQYDTAASAVTGGTEIQSGYVSSRQLVELSSEFFAYQLGRTLAGVSDTITLAIASTSNNPDILAQLGWQELT